MGIKNCKLCGVEYIERDNFKWSCRTHQSDYGGEMWWCCGKADPNTPGCKYSQHESKEDEEDDDEGKKFKELAHAKNQKCLCCKELGHTIQDCHRDPNIKTREDQQEDLQRIMQIKDYRKLFVDTIVTTTHFLKKCVRVPKIEEMTLQDPGQGCTR